MTHYTTALTGYKPICGNESAADLWTKDIELTDCPKCLELFRGGAFMHYSQMPGTIARSEAREGMRYTPYTEDVTCPECLKMMRHRHGPFVDSGPVKFVATDPPWPKFEPPGSFDTKECLIADWLLNGVKFSVDGGKRDIVRDAVSDYLAFMQACQIRREIAELERKDNPIMEINQTGMTATQATGLVSQTPRFGRYDRSPCDHDIWAKITTEGNGICRKCAIITVDMKPTPFYWHGELPEIPE